MIELTALDRLEIIELQSAYAWAIDGRASEDFARVFTPDVDANYSEFVRLSGVDSVARWMEAFHAPFDSSQHLISNHWLEVDGDEVVYRSYVQVRLMLRGHPGGDLLSSGAYYLDRVTRADSGWRISSREVRNMWRAGNLELIELGRKAAGDSELLGDGRALDT
jgi:hypothetical protein